MSERRSARSLMRHRSSSTRTAGGRSAGRRVQSGSPRTIAASVSVMSSPSKALCAREHLVEHAAERPDVGAPIDRAALAPAPGSCSAAVPRIIPIAVAGGRHRGRVGRRSCSGRAPGESSPSIALREAEVEHLHLAVGGDLDVRGLQIAMDDAAARALPRARRRSAGRSRAPRRPASRRRFRSLGQRPRRRRAPGRGTLDPCASSSAVDRRDVRMIERREHLRFALEAGQRGRRPARTTRAAP